MGVSATLNKTDSQILNLIGWKPLIDHMNVANNIRTHKIMSSHKPVYLFNKLTQFRTYDEIKYKYVKSTLRSGNTYNAIPYHIRMKSTKQFKESYKRYRKEKPYKPVITKTKLITSTLWSGLRSNYSSSPSISKGHYIFSFNLLISNL